MKRSTLVITTALVASCGISASAQTGRVITPTSSVSSPTDVGVRAHTNILYLGPNFNATPQTSGPPFAGYLYETPASIACIYNLQSSSFSPACNPNAVTYSYLNPIGGSKAIAIVDAFDDPNATGDLANFTAQFGLASANFTVVYAPSGGIPVGSCTGSVTQPPVDPTGGWEVEEALDIEWSHAMAPQAKIYLVEAQSNSFLDLFCAVTVGTNLVKAAGGGEVSMSWGGGEFPAETLFDGVFTTSGVVYFASSGDSPGVSYPSASPNVVSVGGTTLSRNPVAGNFINENVWQEAGGGPSAFEPAPFFQAGGTTRTTPDVSAVANPATGVWVYDTFECPGCWYVVGGTSVSSPMWAGIVNGGNTFLSSTLAEEYKLYGGNRTYFNDITLGSCGVYLGYFAGPGYDFCSGNGSPNGYIH